MNTRIGKIKKISLGFGGYQDAQLGLSIELGSEGWGVNDFKGFWSGTRTEGCRWSEQDRRYAHADTMLFIGSLLKDAHKESVDKLFGVPVEVTLDGNTLKSWRILTEAI